MFLAKIDAFCLAGPDVIAAQMPVAGFEDFAATRPVHRKVALELRHQAARVASSDPPAARPQMSDRSVLKFYPVTGHRSLNICHVQTELSLSLVYAKATSA